MIVGLDHVVFLLLLVVPTLINEVDPDVFETIEVVYVTSLELQLLKLAVNVN